MSDAVELRDLLTIDIASELRKLMTAQLQGPWQLPAELVRRALAAGARSVEVELSRGGVKVRDEGRPIAREHLVALGELLDRAATPERRHRALLTLEAAGALALLGLPALGATQGELVTCEDGLVRRLEFAAQGRVRLHEATEPGRTRGTTVELRGAPLDAGRARAYLADVCRFAPGTVRVDGEEISAGLTSYFTGRELSLPQHRLRGSLALSHRGEQARVWLLVHGVISTHVGVARAPCFDAVVEVADKIAAGELRVTATAADLREAITPALEAIVDAGVGLMLAVGPQVAKLPAVSQARLLHLLLQALRCRRRVPEIVALPVVPTLVGRGQRVFSTLAAVAAAGKPEPAFVLGPEQEPEEFALPDAPVFVLDTAERGMLAELMGLRFRPAPRRQEESVPLSARLRRGVGRIWQTLRPARRALSEGELSPGERRFLEQLRVALRGGAKTPEVVEICAGAGAPRLEGEVLRLGRDHPDVRAAVAAAGFGEVWAYPAAIALCGGQCMPGTATRATWIRGWHEGVQRSRADRASG